MESGDQKDARNSGKWAQSSPITEMDEEELDEMLSNGVHIADDQRTVHGYNQMNESIGDSKATGEEIENHQLDSDAAGAAAMSKQNNSDTPEKEASVFKSANWLSDSELIFSLTNQVGGLVRALRIFQELDIGIKHVESRKSKRRESEFEIFVDIDCKDQEKMKKLVHHLR